MFLWVEKKHAVLEKSHNWNLKKCVCANVCACVYSVLSVRVCVVGKKKVQECFSLKKKTSADRHISRVSQYGGSERERS